MKPYCTKCGQTRDSLSKTSSWCKSCKNIYNRDYQRSLPPWKRREADLKYSYNINTEQVDILLKNQNNSCAVCNTYIEFTTGKPKETTLNIDHDHTTGKVRGLLCKKCNFGLGFVRDDIKILRQMIVYLEKNSG